MSEDRSQEFVDLLAQIDDELLSVALKILRCTGSWDDAIAFCHSKLHPSVMQAQRDFERDDSQE